MEVRMNKDIRAIKEPLLWGLTGGQLLWSLGAILAAVGCYGALHGKLPMILVQALCGLVAIPFAAAGFVPIGGRPALTMARLGLRFVLTQKGTYRYEEEHHFAPQRPKETGRKLEGAPSGATAVSHGGNESGGYPEAGEGAVQ